MLNSYEDLVETTISATTDIEDLQNIQVGQSGSYEHALFTKSGEKVATTSGGYKVLYRRESDQQFMAYLTNEVVFEDGSGTIRVAGWIDLGSLLSGGWAYYPSVGVSGRYLGQTGFMAWRPYDLGKEEGADVKLIMFATAE
ncbi:allene oxide cyclase barrel-like domain-containing protein [Amycolatopsis silviterrae]|uniref:Allene oxide cyclase barrel-like domain-containing protein n=1 Tax=Amycolatopsis silviterrae TaxID=1656914 RepID=A0ABW5H3F7_9PSEU